MKGCVAGLAVVVLLVALGYAVSEIHSLRADVAALRAEVRASRSAGPVRPGRRPAAAPPADLAETAARAQEALRQGNFGQARQELDRLSRQVAQTTALAAKQKAVWEKRIAVARAALAQRSGAATRAVGDLLRELGPEPPPPGK